MNGSEATPEYPATVERATAVATKRIHQFECEWTDECSGPNFNQQRLGRFVAEALAAAGLLAHPAQPLPAADEAGVVARVEALADEARQRMAAWPTHPHFEAWRMYELDLRDILRAALAAEPTAAGADEAGSGSVTGAPDRQAVALTDEDREELAEHFRVAFDEDPDKRRVRDTWLLAADVAAEWFLARHATAGVDQQTIARVWPDGCRCGHRPEQHDADTDPVLCLIHGDNTHCDYADDEDIAADRWDEGYGAAVIHLCPPSLKGGERVLWAIDHMPKDNPYREGDRLARKYADAQSAPFGDATTALAGEDGATG